ncbi:MAG TPA: hypothetical protein VK586_07205, partial [Streptosporangiaceae bacterium]|nr:hypothetical protein [Streptosporangiaceae bacterium]
MSTLPTWAEYTAALDADMASYMVDSAAALGGLRIAAREDGTIVLDQNAVDCLLAQPEDADGGMTGDPQDGLVMWIGGYSYAVSPT